MLGRFIPARKSGDRPQTLLSRHSGGLMQRQHVSLDLSGLPASSCFEVVVFLFIPAR